MQLSKLLKSKFIELFTSNSSLRFNIIMSFLAKGGALLVSFLTVPLLLNFLGEEEYGIWLTIFSVVSWMSFFDLGLGNGLRNHLTLLKKSEVSLQKKYISTAYWLLGLLIIVILLLLQVISYFVNWEHVFKPSFQMSDNLQTIVTICLWGFGLLLFARLIVSILQAQKKVGIGDIILTIGSMLSFIILMIISQFNLFHKLYIVSIIFTWVTPFLLIIYSIYFFYYKNTSLKPSFSQIRFNVAKQIFGLGLSFFLAQFLVLVLNQSSNIIITQVLSPTDVTIYYIPMRLFSVISIVFGLISYNLLPYFTEAKANNDLLRMNLLFNKFLKLFLVFLIIGLLLLFFSETIINIWIGPKIKVPFVLNVLHLLLALIICLNSIFSTVLNGIGLVSKQLPVFLISVVIYIPASLLLGNNEGLIGIAVATIIAQLIILLYLAFLTKKVLYTKNVKL